MRQFSLIVFLILTILQNTILAQSSLKSKKITATYNGMSLLEVIQDLEKKFNVSFSYSTTKINLDKRITQVFKNTSFPQVLETILDGTGISYEMVNGKIVLKTKTTFQTVRGVVRDKISKFPLPGATVQLKGEGMLEGTNTDSAGTFSFKKIQVGRKNLIVTFIGYEAFRLENFVITSGKEVVLDIELSEGPVSLSEITISPKSFHKHKPVNPMALVSSRSFSPEETSRYAASFLDPARMAQSFAGVSMYDDLSNDIVIRGNSSKGLLWRIEGIEALNPNHFFEEGSTGGAISMLSNNVLDRSDFYTSAFPAEFGNAISGVFDLKFRKGNDQKREYAISTGLLGTEIGLEGPFSRKSKASYLINYRYSTIGLLEGMGVKFGGIAIANFQDVSFNLNFPLKRSNLSFFGLGGASKGGEVAEKDTALSKYLYYKINNVSKYRAGMLGVKYNYSLSPKASLENILSLSRYNVRSKVDTLNKFSEPDLIDSDTFTNEAIRFSSALEYKINASSTLKSGVILSNTAFSYFSYKQDDDRVVYNYLQGRGSSQLLQGFAQWRYNFFEKVIFNIGSHFTYFNLSNNTSIEPRIGLKFNLDRKHSINAGWGIHSRVEPLVTYYSFKKSDIDNSVNSPNTNLKLTKSQHFVLGYDQAFSADLRMKIEAYYQRLYDVPVLNNPSMVVSTINTVDGYTVYRSKVDTLVNEGTGRNYGIEFTVEKFFSRNYYFLITGSLYESKFKVPYFSQEFNSTFNGNYGSNLLAGREFKVGEEGNNVIGINGKLVWHGGRRYTPVNLEKSIEAGEMILKEEMTNSAKTNDYLRSDIAVYYKVNFKKTTHSIWIDIQNVTNRKNTRFYLYDKPTKSIQKIYFNGIIPNIYYKVQF